MALPLGAASKLAEEMSKKGIPGMIAMGKPKADMGEKHMGSGDSMDESPEKEPMDDEEALMHELDEAIGKPGVSHLIMELVERVSAKSEETEEPSDDADMG